MKSDVFIGLVIIAVISMLFAGCNGDGEADSSPKSVNEIIESSRSTESVAEKSTPVPEPQLKPEPVTVELEADKTAATQVELQTSKGCIVIELYEEKAPITTANFLRYVKEKHFDGTVFHRVIKDFMIQGGGFTTELAEKETHEPIVNESSNGLRNDRGTIAMARTQDLNSATCQFYINHKNNDSLNYGGPYGGYAVFGKVVDGMDIVDQIALVPTTTKKGADGRPLPNCPVETVEIKSASVVN